MPRRGVRGGRDGRRAGARDRAPRGRPGGAVARAQGPAEHVRTDAGTRPRDPAPHQHRGHRPVPVLERGLDGLQERRRSTGWAPPATSRGGPSTARWTTSCATRTRSSSRPPPSWGWWASLLLFGFLGAAVLAGVRHAIRPAATTRRSAGVLLAVFGCGITAAAVEWTWEIPGAFLPVVIVAALLAGPRPGRGRGARPAVAPAARRGRGRVRLRVPRRGRDLAHERRQAARRAARPPATATSRRPPTTPAPPPRSSPGRPPRACSSRSPRSRAIRSRPSGR